MKLKCSRQLLANAFQTVGGIVPSRTPKDILRNVKLTVGDGRATLLATDEFVGIHYEIPEVETDSAGEALLPTSSVSSILRELQDSVVDLEVGEEAIWVRGGHSEFRLPLMDASEFPQVPGFDGDSYYSIAAQPLREMIRRSIFATDVESSRYALGGVQAEFGDSKLTLAATDSRRLAVVSGPCTANQIDQPPAVAPVIPRQAMSQIEKSIPDGDTEVRIAVHPNDVVVHCGPSVVYSRLVEGRFPDYSKVIPGEFASTIDLVVGPFYSAVRQAQIVTNQESRGVDFQFSEGQLTLSSSASDVGESKIELPISYPGPELTITFDPRFISEFLRILDSGNNVQLQLIDSESAAVLRADDSYTYVIMPLSRDR